jgi:hypothetical protein
LVIRVGSSWSSWLVTGLVTGSLWLAAVGHMVGYRVIMVDYRVIMVGYRVTSLVTESPLLAAVGHRVAASSWLVIGSPWLAAVGHNWLVIGSSWLVTGSHGHRVIMVRSIWSPWLVAVGHHGWHTGHSHKCVKNSRAFAGIVENRSRASSALPVLKKLDNAVPPRWGLKIQIVRETTPCTKTTKAYQWKSR